ncbi:F-box protein At1g69090-like [Tasmannia lanceolata]|uniref:F-box protein At1g69090-like n=1 Tax=Tasmannia lanceolata TaxID=3420 RepID=UPI004063BC7C
MDKKHKRVYINGEEGRWRNLPIEIGALIAARLSLIEFHAFRSVCKQWQLASSLNSSSLPHSLDPWILFYGHSNCFLYDPKSFKSYFMQIPELKGADCIASEEGWLLVHLEGRLFFFNIFSRAKIDLPQIQGFKFSNHVATFSSPPTSKDCIVFVILNCVTPTTKTIEINMCRHGSKDWETHTYSYDDLPLDAITCVKYIAKDELLHYFNYKQLRAGTYNPSNKSRDHYCLKTEVPPENTSLNISVKNNCLKHEIRCHKGIRKWLDQFGEEKKIWISLCGTNVRGLERDIFYPHESLDYVRGQEESVDDEKQKYQLKAVRVEPRFLDLTKNYTWFV